MKKQVHILFEQKMHDEPEIIAVFSKLDVATKAQSDCEVEFKLKTGNQPDLGRFHVESYALNSFIERFEERKTLARR